MKTIWTIIRKIIRCFTLLLGISLLSFVLLKASPVDPVMASVNYDTTLSEEQYNAIAEYYGLNEPPVTQYLLWIKNFIHGDFGTSLVHREPVIEVIKARAGASALLMGVSWILSGILGFALGTIAAFHQGKLFDRFVKWFSYLQATVPTFWIGLIFFDYFCCTASLVSYRYFLSDRSAQRKCNIHGQTETPDSARIHIKRPGYCQCNASHP